MSRINNEKKQNNPGAAWWQGGLQLFLRLSGWIGGPIIVAVFVGKYLDRKYHTEPWLFLLSVGVAFFISMFALVYVGFREFKKIDQENQSAKIKNQNDNQK